MTETWNYAATLQAAANLSKMFIDTLTAMPWRSDNIEISAFIDGRTCRQRVSAQKGQSL